MPDTFEVPLSRGKVAIVDASDAGVIAAFKWHAFWSGRRWYAKASPRYREAVYMHRLILGARGEHVDHVNGDGLDNTRANLRLATPSQNRANSAVRRDKIHSRFKGVFWARSSRKWFARLHRRGVYHYAKAADGATLFSDEVEAARAFNELAVSIDGSFARLNTV